MRAVEAGLPEMRRHARETIDNFFLNLEQGAMQSRPAVKHRTADLDALHQASMGASGTMALAPAFPTEAGRQDDKMRSHELEVNSSIVEHSSTARSELMTLDVREE
eukprot:CAMPEP_0115721908 /NCGR_PEP_ID=MMETSP0272-20121206/79367_1 /TAXON_ID=71861 /ORGANISM="Scrippsiella trochoidea, Strain CCMP3099" /LENGTH=105 /DNA_ID=CAMNT_0003164839 /DNA_START=87 /DNA_END=401 /DNA_ORIENTATION=+